MKNPSSPNLLFLLPIFHLLVQISCSSTPQELLKGFTATPDISPSHPFLVDPTHTFSLSFFRRGNLLSPAVLHFPSGDTLWQPPSLPWDKHTQFNFNGSLVISHPNSGVLWSTHTNGDRLVLYNTSNLVILKGNSPVWQSFDFPYDTLVETQIFTSAMELVSSNGLYTLRLGSDFIGLYAKFNEDKNQIYYKHRALQAKVNILPGQGPIYIQVDPDGFLGMYQKNGSIPADIQSFTSYQRPVPGIRRIRVEPDGNLKGYYWDRASWVLDYQAITDTCQLPSPCGAYGLCQPGSGSGCSCLETRKAARPGECSPVQTGDLCGLKKESRFRVLRRTGIELPFKDLMGYTKTTSLEACEKSCEMNCTCWGAVHSNTSGVCYTVEYPIETVLEIGDESKVGYFKVREATGKKKMEEIGVVCGVVIIILVIVGLIAYGVYYKVYGKRKKENRYWKEEEVLANGPYKDLGSSSFGSIELSSR